MTFPGIQPVWPLTAGVVPRIMRRAALGALGARAATTRMARPQHSAPPRMAGVSPAHCGALHAPVEIPDDKPAERLAYDELLARQIAFAVVRARRRKRPGRALTGDGTLRAAALKRFGFAPTSGQLQAIAGIDADLAAPHRCCACFRAMSAPAKHWWRCWRCCGR